MLFDLVFDSVPLFTVNFEIVDIIIIDSLLLISFGCMWGHNTKMVDVISVISSYIEKLLKIHILITVNLLSSQIGYRILFICCTSRAVCLALAPFLLSVEYFACVFLYYGNCAHFP